MDILPVSVTEHLYEEARQAAESAYAPYSAFPVGAAVLTVSGAIFRGCNVENASYGLTICAERIALGNTLSSGVHDIKAIAVYSKVDAAPCGACRQFILEFGPHIIVIFMQQGRLAQHTIAELLPYAFSKSSLEAAKPL